MAHDNIAVVGRMLAAFNRGDVGAVVTMFDERCEVHEPPEMPDTPAGGFRGHDGVRAWMANLRDVAGVEFEEASSVTSGDVVYSEWSSRALGSASGVRTQWRTFVVLRVREGRIARAHAFLDEEAALAAAEALGASITRR
jgi:ketosteroid isomerase-like protein